MAQLYLPSATQYIPPSISYRNSGSVDLFLGVGELLPRGTYESEDEESVLVVADHSLASIRSTWEFTTRDHNRTSRFDRIIGFTDIDVSGYYAAQLELAVADTKHTETETWT